MFSGGEESISPHRGRQAFSQFPSIYPFSESRDAFSAISQIRTEVSYIFTVDYTGICLRKVIFPVQTPIFTVKIRPNPVVEGQFSEDISTQHHFRIFLDQNAQDNTRK